MKTVHEWLGQYGSSHKNPVNKTIHWICVPIIYWCVMAFLWAIPTPDAITSIDGRINWLLIVIVLLTGYYFHLSIKLGVGMLIINILLFILTHLVAVHAPWPIWAVALVLFVAAWIGQFIGHHIEGKKPSFFEDLQFLLIGPIWLLADAYRRVGIRV